MDEEIMEMNKNWELLSKWFEDSFGMESDSESMLFMIGVQELGQGVKEFHKTQKMELMHIAVCTILVADGYYEFSHLDADAWPHFESKKKLPSLKGEQQEEFIKKALINYFKPYFTTQTET